MQFARLSIATAAVAALLAIAALVAVAAPAAVTRAASLQGGAARAVYCPDKRARGEHLAAFIRTMQAAHRKYFATHPSAKERSAFLKAQQSQLHVLQRALAQCS